MPSLRLSGRVVTGLSLMGGLGLLAVAPASAQPASANKAPELRPPVLPPPKEDASLSFGPMVGAVLVGGLGVAASFIPVKRGKQAD